jgi:hypothetical protein
VRPSEENVGDSTGSQRGTWSRRCCLCSDACALTHLRQLGAARLQALVPALCKVASLSLSELEKDPIGAGADPATDLQLFFGPGKDWSRLDRLSRTRLRISSRRRVVETLRTVSVEGRTELTVTGLVGLGARKPAVSSL